MLTEALYSDIKAKHDTLIADYTKFKASQDDQDRAQRDTSVEALLSTLLTLDSNITETTTAEVHRIFHEADFTTDIMTNFGTAAAITPSAFVVCVLRSALAVNRVQFDPSTIPSWQGYVEKYQNAILEA